MPLTWKCRDRVFELGEGRRPLIMGILNVTPDSFSDGGLFHDTGSAIAHARRMLDEGADIIDVGGESTRPGASPVPVEEELSRVEPVLGALRGNGGVISIDTTKAAVAERALAAGAHIVNDISAATSDPRMADIISSSGAGAILMHMRGEPRTMQDAPRYDNVVRDILQHLISRIEALVRAGADRNTLAVDPGIGFGKTAQHNIELVAGIAALRKCGRPVVIGLSRKRFLAHLTGRETGERLAAGLGALSYALARQGVDIVRVHDVKETFDAVRVVNALVSEKNKHELA